MCDTENLTFQWNSKVVLRSPQWIMVRSIYTGEISMQIWEDGGK